MLIVYPDYYKDFLCVAGECEDTCCAGWEIVIDPKSLKKYHESKTLKRRLLRDIKWRKGTFRQCKDGRCAFLREDGLCDLYRRLGADSLCHTCRTYPRHTEEFENVREITLSISCPQVARMLMERSEPVRFLEWETDAEECYEDFDYFLFSCLTDARAVMIGILQNRKLAIDERLLLVLGIAHDLEVRFRLGRLGETDDVLTRAQSPLALRQVRRQLAQLRCEPVKNYERAKKHFYRLCRLERLRDEWDQLLIETQMILYVQGADSYAALQEEFACWIAAHLPELSVQLEQLAVYFISTYFAGAVYDGRIYGKADTAVGYVAQLYDLFAARWLKNEKQLDEEDVIEIVYRYSREIEHSDPNLEMMEQQRWWRIDHNDRKGDSICRSEEQKTKI